MSNKKEDNAGSNPPKKDGFLDGFDNVTDEDWKKSWDKAQTEDAAREEWARQRIKKNPAGHDLKL